MNLLILGADGQVGRRLREVMEQKANVVTSARHGGMRPCDVSDASALNTLLESVCPDIIFNAAAYTAVDHAETERETAYTLNTVVPGLLGAWAKKRHAAVVHYSTDYVFDGGARRPYRENDPTAPLGVYGTTKLDGEISLRESKCDHLIIRTAWVYDTAGKNFLRTMLRLAGERSEVAVVDDQSGTPTTAAFLARATAHMAMMWMASESARRGLGGTYHVTAAGNTTWARFAEAIFTDAIALGRIRSTPTVRRISTADFPTPARRPRWSVLDTTLAENRFGIEPPPWRSELGATLALLPPP